MDNEIAYIDSKSRRRERLGGGLSRIFRLRMFDCPLKLIQAFKRHPFPVVISSFRAGGMDGTELFRRLERLMPGCLNILLALPGQHPHPESLPVALIEWDGEDGCTELARRIGRRIAGFPLELFTDFSAPQASPVVIAGSRELRRILAEAEKIAPHQDPVLVTGETGTGKDVLARYIHAHSRHRTGPCQIVNCAAVSPELFEAEFFGHVKGAYTGAAGAREGHFVCAQNGTLILDEIGEIDLSFQAKLLRAIENREIFPVGSQQLRRLNTRVIALTNCDLKQAVAQGRFRADLYYRLNTYGLHLKPLRERPDDVPALAYHLVGRSWFALLNDWRERIEPAVLHNLKTLELPGNVRDLQNLLARVLTFKSADDPYLRWADFEKALCLHPGSEQPEENLIQFLRRVERSRIQHELSRNGHNITRTADRLGLSRQNLQYRMKRLALDREGDDANAECGMRNAE